MAWTDKDNNGHLIMTWCISSHIGEAESLMTHQIAIFLRIQLKKRNYCRCHLLWLSSYKSVSKDSHHHFQGAGDMVMTHLLPIFLYLSISSSHYSSPISKLLTVSNLNAWKIKLSLGTSIQIII